MWELEERNNKIALIKKNKMKKEIEMHVMESSKQQ